MYGIIYKITNLINNKIYIGQTIMSLIIRKNQHKKNAKHNLKKGHLYESINKYGWENFYFEEIDSANKQNELDNKEIYWIKYYNSTDRLHGYNKSLGGRSHYMIDIDKCISLFKSGWSITAIAKEVGCERTHLSERLRTQISKEEFNIYIEEIHRKKVENSIIRCFKENIKIEDILPYIDKKYSFKDIGKELGCSRCCITKRLKEYHKENFDDFSYKYRYRSRKNKKLKIKIDIEKVLQLRKERKTFEEIGKILNCSSDIISERLKQHLNESDYLKISDNKFKAKKFKVIEENLYEQS